MIRNALGGIGFLFCLGASILSLRIAWADLRFRQSTVDGIATAVRLIPCNAEYAEQDSLAVAAPAEARSLLAKSLSLNPYNAWALIQLGLSAEQNGDPQQAERYLIKAAALDQRSDPRWALCDFYFRQSNSNRFWYWARQYLEIHEGDSRALFRLARRMATSADEMLNYLSPMNDHAKASFGNFLMYGQPSEDSASVLVKLIPGIPTDKLQPAVAYSEKLAIDGKVASAIAVWNSLCRSRVVPFQEIDSARSDGGTNMDFRIRPTGRGFDWRLIPDGEITRLGAAAAGELRLRFSGEEPDTQGILSQMIPVTPGGEYEFHFRSQSSGGSTAEGLRWRVTAGAARGRVLAESDDLTKDSPAARTLNLSVGTESLVLLSLDYARPRGSVRFSGTVSLAGLSWERKLAK